MMKFDIIELLFFSICLSTIIYIFYDIVRCKFLKLKCKKEFNLILFILILYVILAISILFVPTSIKPLSDIEYTILDLTPLSTISNYIYNNNYIMLLGGIFITMPLPMLLSFNIPKLTPKKVLILSSLLVIVIEPLQFLIDIMTRFPNFIIDIDDLILNILGVILGNFATLILRNIIINKKLCKKDA